MMVRKYTVLTFVVLMFLSGFAVNGAVAREGVQFDERDAAPSDDLYIEITSPDDGEEINTPDVTVRWVSEGADYHSVELYEVGEDMPIDQGAPGPDETEHTFEEVGEDGDYRIVARAVDEVEMEQEEDEVEITIDVPRPTVEILAPEEGEVFEVPEVTVEWDVENTDHHWIRLNEDSWQDVGLDTSYTFDDLEDGEYTVEVQVENEELDLTVTEAVQFEVELTVAQVWIESPNQGEVFGDDEVAVEWGAENTDVHAVRLNDEPWQSVGLSQTWTFSGLEDGEHTVDVKGEDDFFEDIDSVTFTVDTSDPVIEIISPEDDAVFNRTSTVEVEWLTENELTQIDSERIRIDEDRPWKNLTSAEFGRSVFEDLEDGEYTLQIESTDEAGNTGEKEVTFMVDTEPPEVEIRRPRERQVFTERDVEIRWDASNEGTDIERYEVKIEHKDWIEVETGERHTFVDLIDGNYTVDVRAISEAGHSSTADVTFEVATGRDDLTVEIVEPEDGSRIEGSNLTVRWTSTGGEFYEVRLGRGRWEDVGQSTEHTFTDLPEDEYTITVRAWNAEDPQEGWYRVDESTVNLEEEIYVESVGLLGGSYLTWALIAIVAVNIVIILSISFKND